LCLSIKAQTGEEIVAQIQQKYETQKIFEADFFQQFINVSGESSMTLKGKYTQAGEGKFRISLDNNDIISDGITVWNVDRRLERVVLSDASDRTNSFSLDNIINIIPAQCKIILAGSDINKFNLEFVPLENLGFEKALIEVSQNYLVESVSIRDFNGNTISFVLSNYKFDQSIDPAKFNYIPPEGIEIIDLR
jgi:outer membrane lipoprotein carrier protein